MTRPFWYFILWGVFCLCRLSDAYHLDMRMNDPHRIHLRIIVQKRTLFIVSIDWFWNSFPSAMLIYSTNHVSFHRSPPPLLSISAFSKGLNNCVLPGKAWTIWTAPDNFKSSHANDSSLSPSQPSRIDLQWLFFQTLMSLNQILKWRTLWTNFNSATHNTQKIFVSLETLKLKKSNN